MSREVRVYLREGMDLNGTGAVSSTVYRSSVTIDWIPRSGIDFSTDLHIHIPSPGENVTCAPNLLGRRI